MSMDMYLYDFPVEKMLAMSKALDCLVERKSNLMFFTWKKPSYYLAGKLQNNGDCIQLISVDYAAPLEDGAVTRGWEKKDSK